MVGPHQEPYGKAASVTPNDDSDLSDGVTAAVYVGGAGDLNVDMADGTTVEFPGVTAGTVLPLRVKRIRSTSTTATDIVALYA